jgi:hypothetical protein
VGLASPLVPPPALPGRLPVEFVAELLLGHEVGLGHDTDHVAALVENRQCAHAAIAEDLGGFLEGHVRSDRDRIGGHHAVHAGIPHQKPCLIAGM